MASPVSEEAQDAIAVSAQEQARPAVVAAID
jgi:hypothetical protein